MYSSTRRMVRKFPYTRYTVLEYCSYYRWCVTTASYACTLVHAAWYGNFWCLTTCTVLCACTRCMLLYSTDDSTLPWSHPLRCQIRLFCKLHIDHFLPQNCCLIVCDCTMMNLVIAFFLTVGASLPYCMHVQYGLHGTVVSVLLLYSTVCTMLVRQFKVALFAGVIFVCFAKSTHIDHFVLTFVSLFDSDSHYFLSFYSSLLLYTKNAINPHSTSLLAVRSKSPSPSWLYASVESASCLEYKLYLVTCKRFSVH